MNPQNNKVNILLVDDVPANLVALEAVIEREGAQLFRANSGNEALKLAWKNDFALALIDVQMPGMDGFELVKLLKSSNRTKDIMCIFVTAISKDAKYAVQGLRAGAIDYLYKPLDPMVTNAKVDTYLMMYQQKQQLLKQHKRLESFALQINNSAEIIALLSPDTFQIQEINPAIQKILGFLPERVVGKGLMEMIHPEEREDAKEKIDQFLASDESVLKLEYRFCNIRHDYLWLSLDLVYKEGKLFVNARDISANRHFIEKLLTAKEKAELATKAKEEFLANMSHEIRTPMNGIIGLTRLLQDSPLQAEQRETLDLVLQSSNSLLNIINDILDLSKIESGKIELEMIDFQVRDVVKAVRSLLKNKAEEKQISLEQTVVSDVPQWLIGDPHRLTQVLINLVGNAIKFTSSGSVEIKIALKDRTSSGCALTIGVKDSGIGIPPDRLEAIFENFSQASQDTARKFGGTGLGLTISRKLVHLHGGELKVESEVGKGSLFWFELPFKHSQQGDKQTSVPANPLDLEGLEGMNILLVDDNKINRMVGSRTLKRWNMNITTAEDGIEALEACEETLFDLILMDLQMPKMDGHEATRQIRKSPTGLNADTPIIALTANVVGTVVQESLAAGMDAVHTKPFDPGELFHSIQCLIRDGRQTDSSGSNQLDQIDRISLTYLRELSGGSEQFVLNYLESFTEQIPKTLLKLKEAGKKQDAVSWASQINRLKQDVVFLDYEVAKRLISKLEMVPETGMQLDSVAEMIGSLEQMLEAIRKKFEALSAESFQSIQQES